MSQNPSAGSPRLDKCVVQFGDRTIRGYTDGRMLAAVNGTHATPMLTLRREGEDVTETLALEGVKAVFFVNSFEGKGIEDLRFADHLAPPEALWVRVTFKDGEVLEGLVRNSPQFALDPGFLLAPIDPEGNNWLIFVLKEQVRNLQVLGLRHAPKVLTEFDPTVQTVAGSNGSHSGKGD